MGKNNICCSVPGCNNWGKKENVTYHKFPSENIRKVYITNKLDQKEHIDQRKAWILKLKIGKPVSKYMRVCSEHFQPSDFFKCKKYHCLKKGVVPSMNLPTVQHGSVLGPSTSKRRVQVTKEKHARTVQNSDIPNNSDDFTQCMTDVEEKTTPEDIQAAEALLLLEKENDSTAPKISKHSQEKLQCLLTRDVSVQVNTPAKLTISDMITDDENLNTCTGLSSFKLLDVIVESLTRDQRRHVMSTKDRVILTFLKLKHNLSYAMLGCLFGISQELSRHYIHEMLPQLSSVPRSTINLPFMNEIKKNMTI